MAHNTRGRPAEIAPWFKDEMKLGLKRLLAARLKFQPSADDISTTLAVWLDAVAAARHFDHPERDASRIRRAFITLSQRCREWPTPAEFLDVLPRVSSVAKPRLADSADTAEQQQRTKHNIANLIAAARGHSNDLVKAPVKEKNQ